MAAPANELEVAIHNWRSDSGISPLALGERHVHVWQSAIETSSPENARLQDLLSSDERERAARFHFEKDRSAYIVSRGRLRILLGAYLGASPAELQFVYSKYGKPSLGNSTQHASLSFNVSHSAGLVLYAFAKRRVGVDVEHVRNNFDAGQIAERFFSEAEKIALRTTAQAQRHQAFFRCWTRKEAYIKAIGEGLSHPLHQFDVSLDAGSAAILGSRPDAAEAKRWLLRDIPLPADYIGALAVEMDRNQ